MKNKLTRAAFFALALLTLIMGLFCAACTGAGGGTATSVPTEEAAVSTEIPDGWDFDNRFGRGYTSLIETEDAYYFVSPEASYIYFYDKASCTRDVLCAKPECVHDLEYNNPYCSGKIDAHNASTNFFNGRIYYACADRTEKRPCLFSIAPDGTDRRLETYLDFSSIDNGEWPNRLDLHRGKLYGYDIMYGVDDSAPEMNIYFFSMDMTTGEMTVLKEEHREGSHVNVSMYYYDKWVYFSVDRKNEIFGVGYSYLEIYRWDTEAEVLELVVESKEQKLRGSSFRLYVEAENELWLASNGPVLDDKSAHVYSIKNGVIKDEFAFDRSGASYILCGAAFCLGWDDGTMEIRALDGSVIYEGARDMSFMKELGFDAEKVYIASAFGDASELFLAYNFTADSRNRIALVRYDLTQQEPKGELIAYSPWG